MHEVHNSKLSPHNTRTQPNEANHEV